MRSCPLGSTFSFLRPRHHPSVCPVKYSFNKYLLETLFLLALRIRLVSSWPQDAPILEGRVPVVLPPEKYGGAGGKHILLLSTKQGSKALTSRSLFPSSCHSSS